MSSIASFYLVDTSTLPGLLENATIITRKSMFGKKITDNYWDYLGNFAQYLNDFNGSGYLYASLFTYLEEEKGINLLTTEYTDLANELTEKRGSGQFILTYKQHTELGAKLDPANYSLSEIQQFNEEFSGEGDEETAQLTLEALQLLKENLGKLQGDKQVLLLMI
jgi:hypothetical protein